VEEKRERELGPIDPWEKIKEVVMEDKKVCKVEGCENDRKEGRAVCTECYNKRQRELKAAKLSMPELEKKLAREQAGQKPVAPKQPESAKPTLDEAAQKVAPSDGPRKPAKKLKKPEPVPYEEPKEDWTGNVEVSGSSRPNDVPRDYPEVLEGIEKILDRAKMKSPARQAVAVWGYLVGKGVL